MLKQLRLGYFGSYAPLAESFYNIEIRKKSYEVACTLYKTTF